MGILIRYDKNKDETNPYQRQIIHYAKLSQSAIRLVKAKSIFEKYRIYTDFLDRLFQNHLSRVC